MSDMVAVMMTGVGTVHLQWEAVVSVEVLARSKPRWVVQRCAHVSVDLHGDVNAIPRYARVHIQVPELVESANAYVIVTANLDVNAHENLAHVNVDVDVDVDVNVNVNVNAHVNANANGVTAFRGLAVTTQALRNQSTVASAIFAVVGAVVAAAAAAVIVATAGTDVSAGGAADGGAVAGRQCSAGRHASVAGVSAPGGWRAAFGPVAVVGVCDGAEEMEAPSLPAPVLVLVVAVRGLELKIKMDLGLRPCSCPGRAAFLPEMKQRGTVRTALTMTLTVPPRQQCRQQTSLRLGRCSAFWVDAVSSGVLGRSR
jgi:hypothetical protein